jgi:DNA-binding transcriptional MocR family regulator
MAILRDLQFHFKIQFDTIMSVVRIVPETSDFANVLGSWGTGAGPLYRRLADSIRRAIESEALAPGGRLPAERWLARRLAVSRTTVVAAYEELREEGLLESRQGSGTRVARRARTGAPGLRAEHREPSFRPNTVFRSLIEPDGSTIEFLGAHLPAASPYLEEALSHAREDVAPMLVHHGYTGPGLPALREAIARHLSAEGLPTTPEQVLVTHGAQQAIGLAASLFVRPRDAVVLEDPTYLGAIDVFNSAGARLVPVPSPAGAAGPARLADAVLSEAPRLIYVMPGFHNPTGAEMPANLRREIVRLCRDTGIPVLEDATLSDLPLGPGAPRPLAADDPAAPILTVGSLSKLMWGGLRVGWIRSAEPIAGRLARLKVMEDLGNSVVSQAVAARLFGVLPEVRELRRTQIRERLEAMEGELARRLPEWSWQRPAGGLSLWVRIPRGDAREFAQVALRQGAAVVPGPTCSPSGAGVDHLRLSYVLEPDRIREGIRRLARAWEAYTPAASRRGAELDVLV